jgi:hypothetical protein
MKKNSFQTQRKTRSIRNIESESKSGNAGLEDYVIDYMAFNYIEKVIDTP